MNDEVRVVITDWFLDDLGRLPLVDRRRVRGRLGELQRKGWSASAMNRDVAELEDGIWELRVVGRGSAFRCLCFLDSRARDRVVVLTACVAKASIKKRHVMAAEIQRAKVRRGLYLEQERRR